MRTKIRLKSYYRQTEKCCLCVFDLSSPLLRIVSMPDRTTAVDTPSAPLSATKNLTGVKLLWWKVEVWQTYAISFREYASDMSPCWRPWMAFCEGRLLFFVWAQDQASRQLTDSTSDTKQEALSVNRVVSIHPLHRSQWPLAVVCSRDNKYAIVQQTQPKPPTCTTQQGSGLLAVQRRYR